uniref:Helicase C-terminal domain-containing protein n=1 Tax=Lactuca sativa TaxID=4236 RepID=A0A9R1W7N9_LACSA|nr:hypothetical protein LSAT_V11C300152900 [Lactuca sativa]
MSDDVESLKKLYLRNPYILTLPEVGDGKDKIVPKNVQQFWLDLVQKKVLIFTNTIDTSFRLKLYLEQFGIKSTVLHAELPMNSCLHILENTSFLGGKEEDILADALVAYGQALIASSVSKGDYRFVQDITYFVLTIGFVIGVTLAAIWRLLLMMLVGILSSAFLFYAPSGFGLHGVWSVHAAISLLDIAVASKLFAAMDPDQLQ